MVYAKKHLQDLAPTGERCTHGDIKEICPKTGKVLSIIKPEFTISGFNTWRSGESSSGVGKSHLSKDEVLETINRVINNIGVTDE